VANPWTTDGRWGGSGTAQALWVTTTFFGSPVRFQQGDLARMRHALGQLARTSARRWPVAVSADVAAAERWLLQSLDAPLAGPAPSRHDPTPPRQSDDPRSEAGSGVVVTVATERLLDVAARLLEASELLHRQGAVVDAFALEGIQGRLLEAAVGAGFLEEATPPAKT
jgi:hypothetical protein